MPRIPFLFECSSSITQDHISAIKPTLRIRFHTTFAKAHPNLSNWRSTLRLTIATNSACKERWRVRYEGLLRPFMEKKQEAARTFASSFAPKTRFGLFVRNQVMKTLRIPGWRLERDRKLSHGSSGIEGLGDDQNGCDRTNKPPHERPFRSSPASRPSRDGAQ